MGLSHIGAPLTKHYYTSAASCWLYQYSILYTGPVKQTPRVAVIRVSIGSFRHWGWAIWVRGLANITIHLRHQVGYISMVGYLTGRVSRWPCLLCWELGECFLDTWARPYGCAAIITIYQRHQVGYIIMIWYLQDRRSKRPGLLWWVNRVSFRHWD